MPNTISNNRTVSESQLTVNTYVLVRGNIEFARLLNKIEGDELVKDQRRKMQMGMSPIDKPYTTVTLTNARIVPIKPGFKSPEETFVEERFYKRAGDPADAPFHYTINNKSPYPNLFYQAEPGKNTEGTQIYPEAELANGLDVILILRIFQATNFARKSVTLHSIMLQEPVRYYVGNNTKALEAAGIILHNTSRPTTGTAAPAPAPAAPMSAPEVSNPFSTQPVNAAPAAPAAVEPMPEPEGPWTCPKCGSVVAAGQMFCGTCGTQKNAPVGNPYASQATPNTQAGGIRYDANDTNRNY